MPSRRCRNGRRARACALPQYVEISREGPDHAPHFTTEVRIAGKRPARGTGANKRAAEQAAATALLAREGVLGRSRRQLRIRPGNGTRTMAAEAATTACERGGDRRRCGFIAVIGAPNAGKSTLVNALVGAKVAIVSRKVQTTRVPVRGIAIEGQSQLVFIDTPGMFAPRRRLDRAMVDAAAGAAGDADIVALLVDAAKGVDEDVERILASLERDHRAAPAGAEQDRSRAPEGSSAGADRRRSTSGSPSPRPS